VRARAKGVETVKYPSLTGPDRLSIYVIVILALSAAFDPRRGPVVSCHASSGEVALRLPVPSAVPSATPEPRRCTTLAYRPDLDAYVCMDGRLP
jgi:hypothetical protein